MTFNRRGTTRKGGGVNIEVLVTPAKGVQCERCRRYTKWNVTGLELCGRCRDVGIEDGWLVYDAETATFSRRHEVEEA
jgi:hypothetical protein